MKAQAKKILLKGKKTEMPGKISPMLCTLTEGTVSDPAYIHEIKFDGYRIIAHVKKGRTRLDSRSGLDYTTKYPAIRDALNKIGHDIILDGEVCVLNEQGLPDFETLQKPGANAHLVYYVFDILWLDGFDLTALPLIERKSVLRNILFRNQTIRYSEDFESGDELFEQMEAMGMEGIVSKRRDSEYLQGNRGSDWYKTTTQKRQEFVIGGWVESDKRQFRTLLFGAYRGKELFWVGHSGGGFKHKEMPVILKKLQALETKKSPFVNDVVYTGVIHWIKPKLVANFKYAGFTKHGRIRKPATFLGFRTDKIPADVVIEPVVEVDAKSRKETAATKEKKTSKKKPVYLNEDSGWVEVDKRKPVDRETLEMENCAIELYDVGGEIWKGVTKAALMRYYHGIADYILPYIKDRPLSLQLKLTNAHGPRQFIKDMENRQPSCATIFKDRRRVPRAGKRNEIDYLVCNNVETLLYMINLGCVDVNPWASRTQSPEEPDYLWLDLDPTIPAGVSQKRSRELERDGFAKAVKTALATKEVLDRHSLTGFPKTSGKTGIHIYVPCSGFSFKEARLIAGKLADEIHNEVQSITTRNESVSSRELNVYIDAGQNDYADTLAAPYCVRPHNKPAVSTPLRWEELKAGLRPEKFTMETIMARIKKEGDLFAGVLDPKVAKKNNRSLKKLAGG